MSNLWLYPVRPGTDYADGWWRITDHYMDVEPGDRLVIYETVADKHPPTLTGTAVVAQAWRRNGQRYQIGVELNRTDCKRLSKQPVNATYLKDRLPRRKRPVIQLDTSLRRWVMSKVQIELPPTEPEVLDALRTEAQTINVSARAYKALLRHDPHVIVPLRQRLQNAGWQIKRSRPADLIAVDPAQKRLLLVEGKTMGSVDGRLEIRYAIGQLRDYEYFVLPNLDLPDLKPDLLILLESKPDSKFVPFVESLGIGLAWLHRGRVAGGPLAMKMLGGVV